MVKVVLFDVDGVFLSEERCFDASALTVWELLYSEDYVGLAGERFSLTPAERDIRRLRREVFHDNQVLNFVKARGINSNWDMVFLSASYQLLRLLATLKPHHPGLVADALSASLEQDALQAIGRAVKADAVAFTPDYGAFVTDFASCDADKQDIILYLNELAREWLGIETDCFSKSSGLWRLGQRAYQEWYLGDAYYARAEGEPPRTKGKRGFLDNEVPLAEPARLRKLLSQLRAQGLTLGIGTGRPRLEAEVPLQALGLWELFDANRIVTASDVVAAEAAFREQAPLGKPEPYTYVKGIMGRSCSDDEVLKVMLPYEDRDDVLVVGDSVADFMAARSIGCRFAATLTGLSGQEARATFTELAADYICDDVLGLEDILLK
ncbi:HAD family hydrolase [Numidum massiliense]|uniref:HAD family hydrolase n=1 Tax=Numidum massiliense TaxID=1522315 RepID=UPI0006D59F6F|nr:HAD family hydrolase [Numidum massiliense]